LWVNVFDLKNSINRQINDDLEPLKGFRINFLSHITLQVDIAIQENKFHFIKISHGFKVIVKEMKKLVLMFSGGRLSGRVWRSVD
jgi:hypothetical protein